MSLAVESLILSYFEAFVIDIFESKTILMRMVRCLIVDDVPPEIFLRIS